MPPLTSRRRLFTFTRQKLPWGKNRPRGSRERAPVNVQCEPKDNDKVAHQKLPSTISFEARSMKPSRRSCDERTNMTQKPMLRGEVDARMPLRLEAFHIEGKLAREVETAHMNNPQAVLNLAKGARVMSPWNGCTINPKIPHCRS